MLRKLFGVVGVSSFLVAAPLSVASAAEMPLKAPPPPAPAFSWTGWYVGGNIGAGWGYTSYSGSNTLGGAPAGSFSGSFDPRGMFGGGQIGFNYQFSNNWVAGIEADADYSGIRASFSGCPKSSGVLLGCQNSIIKGDAFGTIRARLGYAWNNVLLYGTGGVAWGHGSATTTLTCVGPGCPGATILPALVVNFQEVVHSALAGNADVAKPQ